MNINLPEKYTDLYVKALQEKRKSLIEKINQFNKEVEEIDTHINSLTNLSLFEGNMKPSSNVWKTNKYNEQWPWTKKITFFQQFRGKLITTAGVVDFIVSKEPELNKNKIRSSVSAALSNRLKTNKYLKFRDPVTGSTYYGPSDYFINEHEPKMEYMPEDLKERLLYNN